MNNYIFGKQTIKELATANKISKRTIRRRLSEVHNHRIIPTKQQVIVLMDTTYWRRSLGLIVMQDAISKKILWYDYINRERVEDYQRGITWLEQQGFII
jgi:hypothetical protein